MKSTRILLAIIACLSACIVSLTGCSSIDEPPGEYRFCCPDKKTVQPNCPEDSCDAYKLTDQAVSKLSIGAIETYTITDDSAPATADACNAGGSTWGGGFCKCGYDYTDNAARCNEVGATLILRFAAPGCEVSTATLSFNESVSAWNNPNGLTATVRRILRPMAHPPAGSAGLCVSNAVAGWFRSGPEAWTLPGAKGDETDRTTLAALRVNAAGAVLPDLIARHDSVLTERYNVTDLMNGCPLTGECVLARYITQGVHANVLPGTVSLTFECASPPPVCGDELVEGAEGCDDGNVDPGDGCSVACAVEAGFVCDGEPSLCATSCGDGIVAGTEACDDGNAVSGDGCSMACLTETCTCQ